TTFKRLGKIPDPGDRSVAANIERIRLLRNQYYGHAADLSLSDSDIAQEWRNIRDIVVELERHLDPTVSGKIEMIKKSITTHCEDISPLFVRTRAFEKAKELLGINGYVVIGGNPGTGKSTMANFLIKQLMEEGKDPLQLYKFKDLYKSLAPNDNIVVFMDNVFGEFSLSSDDVQDFTRTSETTKELFDTDTEKSNYLILTVRSDILKEYTSKVEDDTFFVSSLVDLSSKTYALQENEILQLAIKYDVCKNIEEKEFTRKVSEMSLPIGFPQCCKLAKDIQEDILSLAKNPVIFLTGYFDNLFEKPTAKNAVLVYILLSGGEVDFEFSDNRQMDLEKKHDSLDFIGLKTSFINDFQKSINCFDGFLTIRDSIRNSLQFSHSSVQETLFNFLFYSNPKKMIQNCHHSLLQIFTTTRKSNSTKIIIGQELFADVICRIANVITERSVAGYRSISLLELWNDSNFHEHVLETEQCTSLFKTCQDINRDSMMVHFSKAGNRRWVEYLLPNSDERQRYRSLNVACSKNHPDVVNLILASGEECDLKTCFYAVQSGNLELLLRMCELVDLHQIGLTLNPVWSDVRHSLLQEICLMRQTQFIEKISAKYPFLVGMKNSQGASVLHSVAGSGDKYAFNLLLKFELNPYEKDQESSHTILTCACQNGRLDMVKYLIGKYPALIESHIDLHGGSLFHMAAFSGKIDMFEYILSLFESENLISIESGMKPNIYTKDKIGQSILHVACRNGQLDMCKYLVSRYPKLLNDQDITGANVLHCVALSDNKGLSVLHSASFGGNLEIISFLIKKGLDINELSNDGLNILHFACLWEKLEVCYYLLEKYPKLLDVKDKFDNSTLHYAVLSVCCYGKTDHWEYLIDYYSDLLATRDNDGMTVLHSACFGGNVEIVTYLVRKGLDINAVSNDGQSILHIASRNGKYEVCEYLVNTYPHLLSIKDSDGNSVIEAAYEIGDIDMIQLFMKNSVISQHL
ncbi:uncharacterized protein LOC134244401, partial [Saccostrea cucullata]|uniref:uncharacterized protein LOC134244401 n=1 Tax=Saccostrea cuccullata TaxID=36930 RepID=UPI002ED0F0EF